MRGMLCPWRGYKGHKDGLQPETLADGNWLVKIETKSDTNLRSLYESWFKNALISKSVILWWQAKKGIHSELEGANARRVLKNSFKKVSVSHAQLTHFSTLATEKHMLLILNSSTLTFITIARTTMPFARPLSNGVHAIWTCWNSSTHVCPMSDQIKVLQSIRLSTSTERWALAWGSQLISLSFYSRAQCAPRGTAHLSFSARHVRPLVSEANESIQKHPRVLLIMVAPSDQERPPRWKNHPAEEWVHCIAGP